MTNNTNTDNPNPIDSELNDTAETEFIDPFLAEIHAIRLELYEETKHMNSTERTNHIRQSVAAVQNKFGITPVSKISEHKTKELVKKIS